MESHKPPKQPDLGTEFESFPTKVQMFKTAQGSVYAYFENGKTQRYKTAEKEYREPSDVLVFIPDYAWFVANAPADMRSRFKDEQHYNANITLLAQGRDVSVRIVDGNGTVVTSNAELKNAGNVFIVFIPKKGVGKGEVQFHLPVAKAPKIGFSTFDMAVRGETTSRHLGNKVTEIRQGNPLPVDQIMPWQERDPNEIS